MASPAIGLRPWSVPAQNALVDWSHPLAPVGGWGAVPGHGVDFFGQGGTLTANASFGGTPRGHGLVASSASTSGIQFPFPSHLRNATTALTLVALTDIQGLNANNNVLLVIRDNATDISPYLVAAMYEGGGGQPVVAMRNQAGNFISGFIGATEFGTGNGMRMYAAAIAPPLAALYVNGQQVNIDISYGGGHTGISYPTTPPGIAVGGYGPATTTQGIQGETALALIYPRRLAVGELSALSADPFCMLRY